MSGSFQKRDPLTVPPSSVRPLIALFVSVTPLIAGFDARSMEIALAALSCRVFDEIVGSLALILRPLVNEPRITLLERLSPVPALSTTAAALFAPAKRTCTLSMML